MKKIAFISTGFTGSIMPLVNEYLKFGYKVDLYLVVFKSQNISEQEALQIKQTGFKYGANSIMKESVFGISWLSNVDNFNLYVFAIPGNGKGLFMPKVSQTLQKLLRNVLAHRIKKEHYSQIDIVGHDAFCINLTLKLKNENVIHTLHEVFRHYQPERPILPFVDKLLQYNIPIAVPSEYTRNYMVEQLGHSNVRCIKMGVFIGYNDFANTKVELTLPKKYLLFLGNVLPYKGLDLLYSAWKKLRSADVSLVIAGNGHSSLLDRMKEDKGITVINRWISNAELTYLVKHCQGVVCPYHSASQSGLPVTSYLFNKPILTTDVGAMKEYVANNETGYVVPSEDVGALAEKMSELYHNPVKVTSANIDKTVEGWNDIYKEISGYYNDLYNI